MPKTYEILGYYLLTLLLKPVYVSLHVSCAALHQGILRELVVLLLIAPREMATAAETHVGGDCPNAAQSQSKAVLWIQ